MEDISPASIISNVYLTYTCNNGHHLKFIANIDDEPSFENNDNLNCDGCKRNVDNEDFEENDEGNDNNSEKKEKECSLAKPLLYDDLRWICETCIVSYCIFCKPFVHKNHCPNDHPIVFVPSENKTNNKETGEKKEKKEKKVKVIDNDENSANESCEDDEDSYDGDYICNMCDKDIKNSSDRYEDRLCEIDFCEDCYNIKLK